MLLLKKQLAFNDLAPNDLGLKSNKPIIALLPGSRQQEISVMLPKMLSVIDFFPDYQFVIAGAPSLNQSFYETITWGKDVQVVNNQTYLLLHLAEAALVTSGTATLETALFGVPQVVCYKGNWISYWIARRFGGRSIYFIGQFGERKGGNQRIDSRGFDHSKPTNGVAENIARW